MTAKSKVVKIERNNSETLVHSRHRKKLNVSKCSLKFNANFNSKKEAPGKQIVQIVCKALRSSEKCD